MFAFIIVPLKASFGPCMQAEVGVLKTAIAKGSHYWLDTTLTRETRIMGPARKVPAGSQADAFATCDTGDPAGRIRRAFFQLDADDLSVQQVYGKRMCCPFPLSPQNDEKD